MSLAAYKDSHSYLLDYDGFERTPRESIAVDSTNAPVLSNAYAYPGEKYDQDLRCNSMAVRSTHMPSSVAEFVRCADKYLDAHRFAAIPNYACEKKNSQEDFCYSRWLHLRADARSVARCRTLVPIDMPFVHCSEETNYQWRVNKLLENLYSMHGEPKAPFPTPGYNLLVLVCFKPLYDRLYWLSNWTY